VKNVVMKFGGTSVADADAIRRLTDIVRTEARRSGEPPVLVVSAMSGVTDQLLRMAVEAARGERSVIASGVDDVRRRHLAAVDELVAPAARGDVSQLVEQHVEELRAMLTALSILRDASPRSLDGVASTGELLSSHVVTHALEAAGLDAVWIDARRAIVTDDQYTMAAPLTKETDEALARDVAPHIAAGRLAVIGGYVGATRDGVATTLGRGGSDYSAAIVGAGLGAAEIQIWTDVDGMLTADPRVVAAPRVVPHLSFREASELAYFGAKVLHPSTILPAVAADIPVRILNSRKPAAPGTLITAKPPDNNRPIAALACKRNITVVEVTSTRMLMAHGFLRRLFEVFERCRTAVDVVTTSEVSVSVTIDDDRRLEEIAVALGEFAEVSVEREMALLCAVGENLRADPTLAVRILSGLDGVPLRMVSQAASRRNVTLVLRDADMETAMTRLHDEWFIKSRPVASVEAAP
jgi:aspartate kinase